MGWVGLGLVVKYERNFWIEQSDRYAVLSAVVRRVLAISASSAQSGTHSLGHTVTDIRTVIDILKQLVHS